MYINRINHVESLLCPEVPSCSIAFCKILSLAVDPCGKELQAEDSKGTAKEVDTSEAKPEKLGRTWQNLAELRIHIICMPI